MYVMFLLEIALEKKDNSTNSTLSQTNILNSKTKGQW